MYTLKPNTWTGTKANTPERDAAIITDAVNLAMYLRQTGQAPIDHEVALRTLITLKVGHH
jgi:hypothetical protein